MENPHNETKRTLLRLGVLAMCFVFLLCGGLLITELRQPDAVNDPAPTTTPTVTEPTAAPTVAPSLPAATAAPALQTPDVVHENRNVSILGLQTLTIPADQQEISLSLKNSIENEGFVNLVFELKLNTGDGEYETVFTSDPVAPGALLTSALLTHGIPAGCYEDCQLHIQPYYISDNLPCNDVNLSFTLNVV